MSRPWHLDPINGYRLAQWLHCDLGARERFGVVFRDVDEFVLFVSECLVTPHEHEEQWNAYQVWRGEQN